MNYLVNAVKYSIKNWMLILPLFVLTALATLFTRASSAFNVLNLTGMINARNLTDPRALFAIIPGLFSSLFVSGILTFLVQFIHQPATYGLVNKSLDTGNAGLNDLGAAVSANFVKYILFMVGRFVLYLAIGIASILVIFLLAWILSILKGVGAALMFIVVLVFMVFFIVVGVLLTFWFSAMVIDNLDVVAAAKKSIEVVKGCFWTVLGISILIGLAASVAGFILGFLRVIWVIGPIIYSVVPTAQTFVMIVFSLMLYRERTGRTNAI